MTTQGPPYSALAVANTILSIGGLGDITPMKLQKLLYYCHGWFLALEKKPLIEEPVEAWEYGPVIPTVYHAFKEYGALPIDDYYRALRLSGTKFMVIKPEIPAGDAHTVERIREVLAVYGKYSAIQLSNLTHLSETPWSRIRREHKDEKSVPISDETIREYFVELGRRKT